ncbi:hypothetical protein PUN28_009237 [Cardiocondyla obscurior]|uniref:Uncharacterized protein n=1 Tax=Cardiocondyla obscurior TaxID=286306 RepID=A0AAW2FR35_9HYME
MRKLAGVGFILTLVYTNVMLATDYWWGERDYWGPYPRIPDKQLVKREIAFAEECRTFLKAPPSAWIR